MNPNVKMFLRNALLGVLVIIVTPMLAALLSSVIPIAFLNTALFLSISLMTIVSAGVVAWLAEMLIKKVRALN